MRFGLDGLEAVSYIMDIAQSVSSIFSIVMGMWGIAQGLFS